MVHRESRDPQRVEPRGNRHGLLPVREPAGARQVALLDEQPVGHDLVLRRRGDDELAGGLVVRVVDRRQPLPRAIGPVLAEDHALAMDVVDEAQALGGDARVRDGERHLISGRERRRQRHTQPIGPVGEGQRHRGAGDLLCDRPDGHPLARGGRREIELDVAHAVGTRLHGHRRLAGDLVGAIGDDHAEHVVHGVDGWLTGIGVGAGDRWHPEHGQQRGDRTAECGHAAFYSRWARRRRVHLLDDPRGQIESRSGPHHGVFAAQDDLNARRLHDLLDGGLHLRRHFN